MQMSLDGRLLTPQREETREGLCGQQAVIESLCASCGMGWSSGWRGNVPSSLAAAKRGNQRLLRQHRILGEIEGTRSEATG